MQVNWGGFALAPYLCREIVTESMMILLWEDKLAPYLCREIVTAIDSDLDEAIRSLHLTYVERLLHVALYSCEFNRNLHLT